jgi:hypothetical protein
MSIIGYVDNTTGDHLCHDCVSDGHGEELSPLGHFTETDCPYHCIECEALIPTQLTDDGVEYVKRKIEEYFELGRGRSEILREWYLEYGDRLSGSIKNHWLRQYHVDVTNKIMDCATVT